MAIYKDRILQLIKQLYPTGRAFRISENSNLEKFHDAISENVDEAYINALSILDQILPDNDNFTEQDASDWERRLGMITNESLPLADRMAAIIRKMNHPGTILARQSWDYLEQQLQAAGFDVYVHENIPEQTINQVLSLGINVAQLGSGNLGEYNLGDAQSYYSELYTCFNLGVAPLGAMNLNQCIFNQKVANHIDYQKDIFFNIGSNYKSTFFIGGGYLGDFADVDGTRREELRQLILRIKPAQTVGLMLINYI